MHGDEDHFPKKHRFRNFLLFALTCGIAWYFWKNRNPDYEPDQVESRVAPPPKPAVDPEQDLAAVVDVAEIETLIEFEEELGNPEDLLEPALVDNTDQILDDEPSTLEADLSDEIETDIAAEELEAELADDEAIAELLDFDDIRDRLEDALGTDAEDEYGESPDEEDDQETPVVEDEIQEPAADVPEVDEVATEPEPEPEALLPEADEPGVPAEPTWVKPVDGKCPEGFPIKARFSTGHFHEPGDRGYNKIVPDCCYPTTESAEADGFTPSRWA